MLHHANRIEAVILLLLVLSLATGCGPALNAHCTVETKAGACLTLISIEPYSGVDGIFSTNVDAWQGSCEVPDPANPGQTKLEAEPFTDHMATLTITNAPPSELQGTPEMAPAVTLDEYHVVFETNECARDVVCPELDPMDFEPGPSVSILAGTTAQITLPFVPLRKKFEYQLKSGIPGGYSSYSAIIEIRGRDDEGRIKLEGAAEFSIGDFDLCPQE